jgi:hypothetical protein
VVGATKKRKGGYLKMPTGVKPNSIYGYQMESIDGSVMNQYDENGNEFSWKNLVEPDKVVRISIIPRLGFALLPRHDVFINHEQGEKFIRRFGRGWLKMREDGIKMAEYANCIVTNRYRAWFFASGRAMITDRDYEVHL